MLCVAKVNLSDWPEGQRREVDPANERTQGLLRAGYIAPLQLPRRPAPETTDQPARTAAKGKRPRAADE